MNPLIELQTLQWLRVCAEGWFRLADVRGYISTKQKDHFESFIQTFAFSIFQIHYIAESMKKAVLKTQIHFCSFVKIKHDE